MNVSTVSVVGDEPISVISTSEYPLGINHTPRTLCLREIDIFAQIGAGMYGDVYLVRHSGSTTLVTLKVTRLVPEDDKGVPEEIDEDLKMQIHNTLSEQSNLCSPAGEKHCCCCCCCCCCCWSSITVRRV
jgi:hypothetical protein